MKLIILGFDGLNWATAKVLSLRNPAIRLLFQKRWGIYNVEADKYSSIYLWSSIITGIPPNQLGKLLFVERKHAPSWARRLPEPIKKLGRKILKPYPPSIKGRYETIFDAIQPSLPFNVLAYNEDTRQFKLRLRYSLVETIGNREKSLEAYREWLEWNKFQASEFLSKLLTEEWTLAMTHFWIIDIANHLLGEEKNHETYGFAAETLQKISHYFKDRAAILIISDHGTYQRLHTPEAFWSLNIDPPLKPRFITDFKKLILSLVRRETTCET